MPIPRREEFILDVRRSARTLHRPDVRSDSDAIDTDAIARILHRAAVWLTPKVVERYDPADFADWSPEQQDQLRLAVDEFRTIAGQVPSDEPATVDQFMEGVERFRELIKVLGSMVREEWLNAIDSVERQAEDWSSEAEWRTRRVVKKLSESLIGSYDTTQLLIFSEPNLYVLDPVARFVPGGQGALDLTVQPSYETSSLYRDDNGNWHIHLNVTRGIANGRREAWSKDSFYQCIEQLKSLV